MNHTKNRIKSNIIESSYKTKPIHSKSIAVYGKNNSARSKLVESQNRNAEVARVSRYRNINKYVSNANHSLKSLEKIYDFDRVSKIESFLNNNREVIELLQQAHIQIRRCFSQENLFLSLKKGEEYRTGGELILNIETKKDVETALNLFDKFEHNWWAEMWIKTNSKLSINVTFIE